MRITIFKNGRGVLCGTDPRRIGGAEGILRIGTAEIDVPGEGEAVMPMLFYGCTGSYAAEFTASDGTCYDLGKITVRGGWAEPADETSAALAELRSRLEAAEEKIEALEGVFDTNGLNFII